MAEAVDIAILTVIPAELTAVRTALVITDDAGEKDLDGTIYYRTTIHSELQKRAYQVVLACIGMAGNPEAATATNEVLLKHRPQAAFLMGIAAGMRGKIKIGEVALSERVVAYEPAAQIRLADGTSTEEPRPEIERLLHTMQQDVVHYQINPTRLTELFAELGYTIPTSRRGKKKEYDRHVTQVITARISTIASGEKLLRDPSKLLRIRELHGKIEIGEMEATGFATACRRYSIPWLVIRGISDFGDEFKDDRFHSFASQAAAVVLVDFLRYGLRLPKPDPPPPPPPIDSPPPEPTRLPATVGFIGRDTEIKAFANQLAQEHVAVITGSPGVGKTSLAVALAQQVGTPDKVFWHAFHQGESIDVILWQIAGFLAHHQQGNLWQLLQSARRSGEQLPPSEVLVGYALQLLRSQGYVMCFNDLQDVAEDQQITQLFKQIYGLTRSGDIQLIVTSRSIPEFTDPSAIMQLAGLNDTDAVRLVTARGLTLTEGSLRQLITVTEGNPQFLILAIEALKQTPDQNRLIEHLSEAPQVERYLLREVDAVLTDVERNVLGAVAVLLGYRGSRRAISAVLSGRNMRRTLNDLAARHLLTEYSAAGGVEYSLHAIVRSFYYEELDQGERQAMHKRAGVYYETQEPALLQAARHYELAGEVERAAHLVTSDIWNFVNRGQASPLSQLLGRLNLNQLAPDVAVSVLLARGEVGALLRDRAVAQESFEQVLTRLDALPKAVAHMAEARACRGMGTLVESEDPTAALAWLDRGLTAVADTDELEEALLYLRCGSVLRILGSLPESAAALERSLELLPIGPNQWRANALSTLGVVRYLSGSIAAGKQLQIEAVGLCRAVGNNWELAKALLNLGRIQGETGDWAGALDSWQETLQIVEQLGSIAYQVPPLLNRATLLISKGELAIARTHLERAIKLGRRYDLRQFLGPALVSLTDLEIRLNRWAAAELAINEAAQIVQELGARFYLSEITRLRALLALGRGDRAAAVTYAEQAITFAHESEAQDEEGMSLRILGLALLDIERRDQALDAFARSVQLLDDRNPYEAARARVAWSSALRSSDPARAGALQQAARATFTRLGAQGELAALDLV